MRLRLPNTYVLLAALLALIALSTWLVPGGRYETAPVNGRPVVVPGSFHAVEARPQGLGALLAAPIRGFTESGLIIGFVLLVGGVFAVLQKTGAIDGLIQATARAHQRSATVRALMIPLFVTLFSLGGATFGMAEEAIPFVLVFIPLALALLLDTLTGVAIPFVGSQIGFATAFLNPFNVGVAQGIAGLPLFSGLGYRTLCWAGATALTAAYLHGAKDLVGTALVIALAKGTVILLRDGQILDTLLHAVAPWVASEVAVLSAYKMFGIQTVINFFIHSGTGQAALTMPLMAPLADLVGLSRQTAVLAFQFGELTTTVIPTSGITVGVLALARLPFGTWVRWMLPLQGLYLLLALALLVWPALAGWA